MVTSSRSVWRLAGVVLAMSTGYALAIVSVAWVIAGEAELRALLGALHPAVVPAVVGLQLLALGAQAARWRLLLRGPDPVELPFRSAVGIQLAAVSCNVALPLLGGDLVASWILAHRRAVPWARSLAASIYARLTGLLTCAALAAFSVLALLGGELSTGLGRGFARELVAVALFAGLVLGVSLSPRPLVALGHWVERSVPQAAAASRRRRLGEGLMVLGWWLHATAVRDRRWVAGALLWSAANYVAAAMAVMVLARGLGLAPSPLTCLALVTLGSLSGMATLIAPAGGVVEELALFAMVQQLMGASAGTAAVFVLGYDLLRTSLVVLGVLPVIHYLRGARSADLAPLWTRDVSPILDSLRAGGLAPHAPEGS
ncbi:MAG: lysylphosphatidylglycerol synthase transmembrane domain-containing protein [Pseudomonadota bacterium]